MSDQKNKNQKSTNKWMALSGGGIQMGITIFLSAFIGDKLDIYFMNETPWCTLGFTLFGIFVSVYMFIRQVTRLND